MFKTAAICANPACGAELREGTTALYDDYRDQHFCGSACFDDWWSENSDKLAHEYRIFNVDSCDL